MMRCAFCANASQQLLGGSICLDQKQLKTPFIYYNRFMLNQLMKASWSLSSYVSLPTYHFMCDGKSCRGANCNIQSGSTAWTWRRCMMDPHVSCSEGIKVITLWQLYTFKTWNLTLDIVRLIEKYNLLTKVCKVNKWNNTVYTKGTL